MLEASVILTFAMTTSLTGVGVGLGGSLEPLPAFDGALDVGRGHFPFLDEAVREHRGGRAMEKVEDAIVPALQADPQPALSQEIPAAIPEPGLYRLPRGRKRPSFPAS